MILALREVMDKYRGVKESVQDVNEVLKDGGMGRPARAKAQTGESIGLGDSEYLVWLEFRVCWARMLGGGEAGGSMVRRL